MTNERLDRVLTNVLQDWLAYKLREMASVGIQPRKNRSYLDARGPRKVEPRTTARRVRSLRLPFHSLFGFRASFVIGYFVILLWVCWQIEKKVLGIPAQFRRGLLKDSLLEN